MTEQNINLTDEEKDFLIGVLEHTKECLDIAVVLLFFSKLALIFPLSHFCLSMKTPLNNKLGAIKFILIL